VLVARCSPCASSGAAIPVRQRGELDRDVQWRLVSPENEALEQVLRPIRPPV
jgi:hypothetical protein